MAYPLAIAPAHETADTPAPYMRVTPMVSREQIRERLAKATSVPSATRAILIEVCTLVEHGGKGRCFANNQHFATKACCSVKTVTRTLDALVKNGLLALHMENKDNAKRELVVTPKLLSILAGKGELTMDRVSIPLGTGCPKGRDRVSQGSGQGVPHNRVKEESKEEKLLLTISKLQNELQSATASCAEKEQLLAEANLKIENLEARIEKSLALFAQQRQEITDLKASSKKPEELAARPAKKPKAAPTFASEVNQNRQAIIDRHHEWYVLRNGGMKPGVRPMDAKAALIIFSHFRSQDGAATDQDAHEAFGYLLAHWDKLSDFNRRQQTLHDISTQLPNLIGQLPQHGLQPTRPTVPGLIPATDLADSLALCRAMGLD